MPRLKSLSNTPAPQRDTFVGRVRELAEFRNSVRYLLGKERPPGGSPLYPHIFLPHGDGGMGKSALLRRFLRIAGEEGLAEERIVAVELDHQTFPTPEALAQALARATREKHPGFGERYRQARARRDELAERYRELQQQWVRWEALRGDRDDLDAIIDAHRRRFRHTELQQARLGEINTPFYMVADAAGALSDIQALVAFRDGEGRAPRSFDELLRRELGDDAALFGGEGGLGQALADDLYELAEAGPLVLALDTYERADQHDDWLRTAILAEGSARMLTIVAGRNRHDEDYRRTFSGDLANLVRSYNLNDQALQPVEIKQYLAARLQREDSPDDLVAEVHEISRGIPVALEALGDQLAGDGDLAPYRGMELATLDRREVVRKVTERFLLYAVGDKGDPSDIRERKRRDRQRIRALSLLLRPDAELACALWGLVPEPGQAAMADLSDRHSFIFAGFGSYEMHDLVREFVRADTLAEGRNSFDWPALEAGLRRALPIIERRIARAERHCPDPDESYDDAGWREAILDRLNALLWLDEQDQARRLLLNRWVEARHANTTFAQELSKIAAELAPETPEWKRVARAVQASGTDIPWSNDTHDYTLLESFLALLEAHTRAVLYYLRAGQLRAIDVIDETGLERLNHIASEADLDRLDRCIALAEQGRALDMEWMPLRVNLARAYANRGSYKANKQKDFTGALIDHESAVALRPDDPDMLYNRGVTKCKLRDWIGALADLEQSLALRPDEPITLTIRGLVKEQLDDLVGALADYNQALTLRPNNSNILHNRGVAKQKLGDWIGALADYNLSLALQPDNPIMLSDRSVLKSKLGDLEGALADYNQSLMLQPDDADTMYNLACLYALQRQADSALDWLARAIEQDPSWCEPARTDPDFDAIRDDPRFVTLVGEG